MPDAFSPGKLGLIEPATGSYVNTWGGPLNSNAAVVDAGLSQTTTVTLSNIDVTLSQYQYPVDPVTSLNSVSNLRLVLSGAISANLSVRIPANVPGMWIADNQTTGSSGGVDYTVTVKTTAGGSTGVTIPRGTLSNRLLTYIYSDGTNVYYADRGGVIVNAPVIPVATDTVNGIVKQGLLSGNCVQLNAAGKTPYQTDKYIISTADPDPAQGDQNWLWFKV